MIRKMWKLPLILHTLLIVSSGCSELLKGQKYQVVYPRKLHSLYKRDTQNMYPDLVRYELNLDGAIKEIHIEKSVDLFADGYTESHYKEDGTLETLSPTYQDHCLYQGRVNHMKESTVVLSICQGLSGVIQFGKRSYFIEPLRRSDSEAHAVYEAAALRNGSCGVHSISSPKPPTFRSIWTTEAEKQYLISAKKYIEFFMVADNSIFLKYGSTIQSVKERLFNIVNYVNKVYKHIDISVALVGIEIWDKNNQIEVVSDIDVLLNRFTQWRKETLLPRKRHDNAQFLTNVGFNGVAVGYAPVSVMCAPDSVGINQDSTYEATDVASTIAHEMGHNLGMSHDTPSCTCGENSCIMFPSVSLDLALKFTDCSLRDLRSFIYNSYPECMLNIPARSEILSPPTCGNKLTETGEECDCGELQECTSKCCDPRTCRIKPGYECSEGECCQNCRLRPAGTVCRPAKDECDLADFCDGKSPECSKDSFKINGFSCMGGKGACYNGTCPVMNDQCALIWGGEAVSAPDYCFDANTLGTRMGYCKKEGDKYTACLKQDKKCGLLFCIGGDDPKMSGTVFKFGACKTFVFEYGLVSTGSKCGPTNVCFNGKCSNIEETFKTSECTKKCPEHSVCDHEMQCQCEEGWMPPDCSLPAATPTPFYLRTSTGPQSPSTTPFYLRTSTGPQYPSTSPWYGSISPTSQFPNTTSFYGNTSLNSQNPTSQVSLEVFSLWSWGFLLWWLSLD